MNSILKKIFIIIIILIFLVAFNASYSALNLDNLAFVIALGIDVSDTKEIKVTFQFVKAPSTSEGSNQESQLISDSIDANSIANALNIMNTYFAKRLDLSHCRIIVFSEEIAQYGISDYVYTLMNDVQIRPSANIVVSKCNAEYYIKSCNPSLENSISRYYDLFPDSSKYTGYLTNATIGDFFNALICNYCEPYTILGGVTSSDSGSSQTANVDDSDVQSGASPISGTKGVENIGMAVFKHDKLVGELNAIETVCFNILRKDLDSFIISVPDPNNENSNLDIFVTPLSKSKIDVKIVNGSPYIKIDYYFGAKVYSVTENSSYLEESSLSAISNSCNKYLESVLNEYLYKTSQEFKSDVTGLGKYVVSDFATNEEFENYNWSNNYINSTFDVTINTDIDSGVLLTKT